MKKILLLAAAAATFSLGLSSCDDDGESVFVLGNIPYEDFFENEADSFDALTSATSKVANGTLTYGTFHEKAQNVDDSVFGGITYPVKVSKSALEKAWFSHITDQSPEFDISTTAKGKTTTIRYSGKQNLYQSSFGSYYVLSETPAFYKTASISGGNVRFSKIVGTPEKLGTLYVAVKADPKHTQGFESALYTDGGKTPLSFGDGESAQAVSAQGLSPTKLNTVRAVIATTADGKKYGLTLIKNVWRGNEFGVPASSEIVGKNITSLTFVTERGLYTADSFVLGTSAKVNGETVVSFDKNAQAVSEFTVVSNYAKK